MYYYNNFICDFTIISILKQNFWVYRNAFQEGILAQKNNCYQKKLALTELKKISKALETFREITQDKIPLWTVINNTGR